MADLKPSHSLHADLDRGELHFSVGGYWTLDDMRVFLTELSKAVSPLIEKRKPFAALGDLEEFVPQNRETAEAIRDSLLVAKKNGMTRFAVVSSSSLVKMQYRRLTEGLEVEFFDTKASALGWLRSN
ncbi:MAG: STAS/SEC14 domain-containing protein [Erythrobacter sp.]|jgi:hypothetical protein|nr:STAS/SEC14 domain-containing protein [Erythrobacter sp.]